MAQKVLCYFTAADGPNDTELSQRLREKLPDYMLPKLIKLLRPLPLLNNGKVDRQVSEVNWRPQCPPSEVNGVTRTSFLLQALLADYESRCRSDFEFGDVELRPHVPTERFEAARLVLDSVARILSCTDESQKPTLSRDA